MPENIRDSVLSPETIDAMRGVVQLFPAGLTKPQFLNQASRLDKTEIIFTSWHSPRLDEEMLAHLPALKAVFHCAGSTDHITSEAFWKKGIPLASAIHANSIPVAEFTYSQIVLSLKGYWRSARMYKKTRKIPYQEIKVCGLKNATVGIISLGRIARLLVEKLRCLDVELCAFDPFVTSEDAKAIGVRLVSLEELFARSHVISCHSPVNDETRNMVTGDLLRRMPLNGTFINTARGAIVDHEGLYQCLKNREDLQVLLDVTEPEPLDPGTRLLDLPNLEVSAHIAGSIGCERTNLGEAMHAELLRFLDNEPLLHEVMNNGLSKAVEVR